MAHWLYLSYSSVKILYRYTALHSIDRYAVAMADGRSSSSAVELILSMELPSMYVLWAVDRTHYEWDYHICFRNIENYTYLCCAGKFLSGWLECCCFASYSLFAVLTFYDYLLTLHMEISEFWSRDWRLMTMLFFTNRYPFIFYQIFALILSLSQNDATNKVNFSYLYIFKSINLFILCP